MCVLFFEEVKIMIHEVPQAEIFDDKEVYAFAGLALYCGQVFEKGLVNLLMVLHAEKADITKAQYDDVFTKYDSEALGKLLRKAKGRYRFSREDIDFFKEVNDIRNHLVHHFFAENAGAFLTGDIGFKKMIEELQYIIKRLQEADHKITNIYHPLQKKYGMTEEILRREEDKIVQDFLGKNS